MHSHRAARQRGSPLHSLDFGNYNPEAHGIVRDLCSYCSKTMNSRSLRQFVVKMAQVSKCWPFAPRALDRHRLGLRWPRRRSNHPS